MESIREPDSVWLWRHWTTLTWMGMETLPLVHLMMVLMAVERFTFITDHRTDRWKNILKSFMPKTFLTHFWALSDSLCLVELIWMVTCIQIWLSVHTIRIRLLCSSEFRTFWSFRLVADLTFSLRSRPVAVMEATTAFETETKLISLDDKICTVTDGSQVTCTGINSCLKYNGVNLPQFIGTTSESYACMLIVHLI